MGGYPKFLKWGVLTPLWTMVTVGSNFEAIEPLDAARRWSKEDKDYIGVARPALIGSYNKSMGETDQADQAISTYHLFVYNMKWFWPLFLYCFLYCIGISIQFMAIIPHIWERLSLPWTCTINCKLPLKSTKMIEGL